MADLFGIRPWEMELLRVGEIDAMARYVTQLNKSAGRGA